MEELFRDTFSDYEEKVNPELWGKISSRLDSVPFPGNESNVSGSGVSGGAAFSSGIIKWVAITALVVASGTGVYYLTSLNQSSDPQAVNTAPVMTEISTMPDTENNTSQTGTTNHYSEPASENSVKNNAHRTSPVNEQNQIGQEKASVSGSENQNVSINETSGGGVSKSIQTKTETASAISGSSTTQNQSGANLKAEYPAGQNAPIKIKADQTKGHAPFTVHFRAEGGVSNLEWNYGDGTIEKNDVVSNHTFTEPGEYQVTVKPLDGAAQKSEKITITVTENLDIQYIPNVFTPNGDGINDFFRFEAPKFTEIEVIVYDQTGNQAAKFTDPAQGWDGNLKTGAEAKEGTYLYTIFATSPDGRKHQQKGWVRLIRKK